MDRINFELYKSTMQKMACVSRTHRAIFEKNISNLGIHHSQHCLLIYIAKWGEITSQKQIAEKFGISSAAIARSLKALEIEGYIERCALENDSRLNRITITDKGKKIVRKTHIMFRETDACVFEDFSEEEIMIFNSCLDKMQARLLNKFNEDWGESKNE